MPTCEALESKALKKCKPFTNYNKLLVSAQRLVSQEKVQLQLLMQDHYLANLITAVVQGCISIAICSKDGALHTGNQSLHQPHLELKKQVARVSCFMQINQSPQIPGKWPELQDKQSLKASQKEGKKKEKTTNNKQTKPPSFWTGNNTLQHNTKFNRKIQNQLKTKYNLNQDISNQVKLIPKTIMQNSMKRPARPLGAG